MARPLPIPGSTAAGPGRAIRGAAPPRVCSPGERVADAVIHALGVGASPIAIAVLMRLAIHSGGAVTIVAAAVYGLTLFATLTLSATYNLVRSPARAERLRRYDHAMIFLMIAGSYTPFAMIALGGASGLMLLVAVWLLACVGAALKLRYPRGRERIFVGFYLALGWIGLIMVDALIAALPVRALLLLGLGGVLYTTGVVFHLWQRLPYQNAIWHSFVLAGAACHYGAILTTVIA